MLINAITLTRVLEDLPDDATVQDAIRAINTAAAEESESFALADVVAVTRCEKCGHAKHNEDPFTQRTVYYCKLYHMHTSARFFCPNGNPDGRILC